ncbi:MAG: type II secretion system protein [Planctomycetota bacterium]|jgi:prepilin-type N-terminal cleavage/methylation domain-containing protein/prepilin-type processing-associated H-X9-DG protein
MNKRLRFVIDRKAFSLIELLVVISVISLLMGLLVPALSKAREQSRGIFCLNSLRQMVMAANNYINENDGYYPLAGFVDYSDLSKSYEWDYFKTFENGQVKEIEPGYLWHWQTNMEIQQCPSYDGSANSPGDPYTGYNYNTSYIGGYMSRVSEILHGANSSKAVAVLRPSECAVFGDGEFEMGANKFMRSPQAGKLDKDFSDAYRYAGTQGYRHSRATNVGYCDGSARAVRDLFTETNSKERIDDYNLKHKVKVGFLSEGNMAYDLK